MITTDLSLVDEDRDLRTLLAQHFVSEGVTLRTASSLAQVIEAVADRTPDLALVDNALGMEDGSDVLRELTAKVHSLSIFLAMSPR
jgi:DNA-binding response OmpR family regulator